MGKSLLLAAMLTFFGADLFAQTINSVTVSPQNPTSNDEVSLVITGDRWSTDVEIVNIAVSQNFNTWTVDITFQSSGEVGLPVLVPFDTIVSLGYMTIGYYDCQVNGIFGTPQDFESATWAVLDPTSIDNRHDEKLKFNCSPNPFSSEANLNLSIPNGGKIDLKIYDILGQQVATIVDEHYDPGVHQIRYSGSNLPAGRYYFHLSSGGETLVQPVLKK